MPNKVYYVANSELYHHGILGMKWGQRNGPPYPLGSGAHSRSEVRAGWQRSLNGDISPGYHKRRIRRTNPVSRVRKSIISKYGDLKASIAYKQKVSVDIGKAHADTYLSAGIEFSRIQTNDDFRKDFALYSTYQKADINKYAGLFGKNLTSRANADASRAEKQAKKTGDYEEANRLRDYADNLSVYQVKMVNTGKLKVPSTDNACRVTSNILKSDKEFVNNVIGSINDSKQKMRRPSQQMLFSKALTALKKDPSKYTKNDVEDIYKAINLTLTNHNDQEVAMQKTFYKALKDNGYDAILDLNDKSYSSYHAKNPVIIFNTDNIALKSISTMDQDYIDRNYRIYNTERIVKEFGEQTFGTLSKFGDFSVSQATDYLQMKFDDYLRR